MKLLIFVEGTILMHKNGIFHSPSERIAQVRQGDPTVHDYASYVPVGKAVEKVHAWKKQGGEMVYLTSRTREIEIRQIHEVLQKYKFPSGKVVYRLGDEKYKDVVSRICPNILIEDDCESIGGKKEMIITTITPHLKKKINSIVVREFEGIDTLSDTLSDFMFSNTKQ